MMPSIRPIFRVSAIVMLVFVLGGCVHLPTVHWPWRAQPVLPPEPADELVVTLGEGTTVKSFPQYWKRNTLIVDLQEVSGTGSVTLQPRVGKHWPVRLALRVTPGKVGNLEVHGQGRVIMPLWPQGIKVVEMELSPDVYTPETKQLVVRWEPYTGCCSS